jgi:hypothetical protein
VTYCFAVTNTGNTYLNTVTLDDADLHIDRSDVTLLSGSEPLAPGATLVFYYETLILTDLVNTATVSGTPTNSGGVPIPGVQPPTDSDTASVCPCGDIIDVCAHPCLSKLLIKRHLDREFLQFAFVPQTPVDPANEVFRVQITNANGVVYEQEIPAGSLVQNSDTKWLYKNRLAAINGGPVPGEGLPGRRKRKPRHLSLRREGLRRARQPHARGNDGEGDAR